MPSRSATPTRFRLPAMCVLAVLVLVVGFHGKAAAQQGDDSPPGVAAREVPVTLGQRGPLPQVEGWLQSGPAVPMIALATLAMLAAGALLIARRCHEVSTGAGIGR